MSPDKTKYLFDTYPELYAGRKLPLTQNLMAFGFEHADGWFKIIDDLSKNITKVVKAFGTRPVMAVQVKEKFGTLRFYTGGIHSDISDIVDILIRDAEDKSGRTCEVCGERGKLRGASWVRTLCPAHALEANYEIEDWEQERLDRKNKNKDGDKPEPTSADSAKSASETRS